MKRFMMIVVAMAGVMMVSNSDTRADHRHHGGSNLGFSISLGNGYNNFSGGYGQGYSRPYNVYGAGYGGVYGGGYPVYRSASIYSAPAYAVPVYSVPVYGGGFRGGYGGYGGHRHCR